ncbi:MAG: bifunctional oligoribonuclease/PAP phosphatase NrnA [Oscillospiraceae bacterium]|jgi:phosphoesterase RecJ-like protein|nr:bifunctional oligoribonuclease/PAP phosphatase NrnA [Oscillospiraceae bacterium]
MATLPLNLVQTAAFLRDAEDILILTHGHPDGDTLGAGFALLRALRGMAKRVRLFCPDEIPPKFSFMADGIKYAHYAPQTIIAVDLADKSLLGDSRDDFPVIHLCIDHHSANRPYAENAWVDPAAAACCEMIYQLLRELNAPITPAVADCLYTGVSTDTGCFRYSNVTSGTLRIAAKLLDYGARAAKLNQQYFETKRKAYFVLERMALETLEVLERGKYAVTALTRAMYDESGAGEDEAESIAAIPRQVEGVLIGATLKERKQGGFKASLRSVAPADVSRVAAQLGGGGHLRAAGCTLETPDLSEARAQLLAAVREELARVKEEKA